jgi:hypothetical protein
MKRKIFLTLIVFCFLAAVFSVAGTREPARNLKQALAMAEKYVEDKNLDVSSLFLASVYRSEFPENSKMNNWTVIWVPKDPHVLDGELRVYIYDDGRIEHGGSA